MTDKGTTRDMPLFIEDWRAYRNLTQRELAKRSGLALTTINEIETGKRQPRPSTLHRLAAALDTDDWNLHNPARSSYGILPEVVRLIERLGQAASEIAIIGNDGRGLARFYSANHAENWDAALEARTATQESITLLLGFWQELGPILLDQAPDDHARELVGYAQAHQLAVWRRAGIELGGADGATL